VITTGNAHFPRIRELAAMFVSMRKIGITDRALVVRLLHGAMVNHPEYLGLWCVFEPDAFDGRDAEFVGRKGHDACGRFAPRWDRNEGRLRFGCSYGHDNPAVGGWYYLARDARQEVVFGPYDEQALTGLPVLCLTRVAPILERDRFIGAVGVDVSLDSLLTTNPLDAGSDHPLETMLERWHVFLRGADEIEFASRAARRLIAQHIGPCRHGRVPAALAEKLDAIRESPVLLFGNNRRGLRITVVRHPHTGRRILSLEAVGASRSRAFLPGISAREQEVLEWVELGKSNGEIALILGISEHTVRHHLERIFAKLGVENRRSAMLCVRGRRSRPTRFISRVPVPLAMPG
jgi:DNA-binding CsgD family transcriptional regulator